MFETLKMLLKTTLQCMLLTCAFFFITASTLFADQSPRIVVSNLDVFEEIPDTTTSLDLKHTVVRELGKDMLTRLKRFGSLHELSIEFPLSYFEKTWTGNLPVEGGWSGLSDFKSLRRLEVDGIPATSCKQILAIKTITSLVIHSYATVGGGSSVAADDPIDQLIPSGMTINSVFDCFKDVGHLAELSLPPATPDYGLGGLPANKSPTILRLPGGAWGQARYEGENSRLYYIITEPNLKELELGESAMVMGLASLKWPNASPTLLSAVATRSNIEVLSVKSEARSWVGTMHIPSHDWYRRADSLRHKGNDWPQLRVLRVEGNIGYSRSWKGLATEPQSQFYGTEEPSTTGEPSVELSGLRLLRNLEELDLEDSSLLDTDLLFASLATLPKLTTLRLRYCPGVAVTDDFRLLHESQSLSELDLTGCRNLTDDCMRVIADIPSLRKLTINGCKRITVVGIGHLMRAKALESLTWTRSDHADDAAALVIAKHLTSLRELHLDAGSSPMTSVGRRALALRGKWESVTLPGKWNPIVEQPATDTSPSILRYNDWNDEELALLVSHSPNLSKVRLAGLGLSANGITILSKSPNLTLLELRSRTLDLAIATSLATIPSLKIVEARLPTSGDREPEVAANQRREIFTAIRNRQPGGELILIPQ